MDIVETGHDEAIAAALDGQRFIDERRDADMLQRIGHAGGIVIAEHRDDAATHFKAGQYFGERYGRARNRRARRTMDVAGDRDEIDSDAADETPRDAREFGQAVEMRVADLQDAIAVESRRQIGKGEFVLDQSRRERIAAAARMKADHACGPCKAKGGGVQDAALPAAAIAFGIG